MLGISKSFHTTQANRDINFSVKSGEILGLLGENGAGKTTLMRILFGLIQPDTGEIRINGQPVRLHSPRQAIQKGIGMVHQHFKLVQNHTVAENIALGFEGAPFFFPGRHVVKRLKGFSERYGLEVKPWAKVWQLSAGEQQRVEIVKTLLQGAALLVLDEPTSVLTPQEAEELFAVLGRMKAEGQSVIFISHKLEEIISICDRVLVLRRGKLVGESGIGAIDKATLARMMVGREVLFDFEKPPLKPGRQVLSIKDLCVLGDRQQEAVKKISFQIDQNEIFGIAGVSGNGQRELIEAITGLRSSSSGSVLVDGRDVTNKSAGVISARGIAHIPEERIRFGVVPNLFIYENAVLKQHRRRVFSGVLSLNYKSIRRHTEGLIERFRISAPSIDRPIKNLSGGNIQKLILGREISSEPTLLVAAHPTYGLDVGATEYIRKALLDLRSEGVAILLVSEDLEEIFELSDRIAVMFAGEIMGILPSSAAGIEDIGLMMAGSKRLTEAG